MIDYAKIISVNYPNTKWILNGESYDGLDWQDTSPKPTQSELDSLWQPTQEQQLKNQCKIKAKQLISTSDWAALPDVGLKNSADFVTYRGILRGLIITPVADPVWPTEPTPIWE